MIAEDYSPGDVENDEPSRPLTPPPASGVYGLTPQMLIGSVQGAMNFGNAAAHIPAINNMSNDLKQQIDQTSSSIRPYFAVGYSSILAKMRALLFPFNIKNWSRINENGQPATPLQNPNAADLYLPLMSTFIFVLFASIYRAAGGKFTFTYLTMQLMKLNTFYIVEVIVTKVIFFVSGYTNGFPVITLFADFSCLSFYLTVCSLFAWNSHLRMIVMIYVAAASFYRTVRAMRGESSINLRQTKPSSVVTYSLIIIALVQVLSLFLFVPSVNRSVLNMAKTVNTTTSV